MGEQIFSALLYSDLLQFLKGEQEGHLLVLNRGHINFCVRSTLLYLEAKENWPKWPQVG